MIKALVILTALVGYTSAVKICSLIKMLKIKVDGWEKKDYEQLLEDPKFKKYMR